MRKRTKVRKQPERAAKKDEEAVEEQAVENNSEVE